MTKLTAAQSEGVETRCLHDRHRQQPLQIPGSVAHRPVNPPFIRAEVGTSGPAAVIRRAGFGEWSGGPAGRVSAERRRCRQPHYHPILLTHPAPYWRSSDGFDSLECRIPQLKRWIIKFLGFNAWLRDAMPYDGAEELHTRLPHRGYSLASYISLPTRRLLLHLCALDRSPTVFGDATTLIAGHEHDGREARKLSPETSNIKYQSGLPAHRRHTVAFYAHDSSNPLSLLSSSGIASCARQLHPRSALSTLLASPKLSEPSCTDRTGRIGAMADPKTTMAFLIQLLLMASPNIVGCLLVLTATGHCSMDDLLCTRRRRWRHPQALLSLPRLPPSL